MKAQAELCNELSQCREVTEAVEAHRKFSERVTSDYSSEIGQLATIMNKELAIATAVATEVVGEAGKAGKLAA
jgi:nitrate/nitrite-specific signal transduction histidine kinase